MCVQEQSATEVIASAQSRGAIQQLRTERTPAGFCAKE